LVTFSNGSSTLFDSEFLYAHRHDKGNRRLRDTQSSMMVPLTGQAPKAGTHRNKR
jgi:hypothetical protein